MAVDVISGVFAIDLTTGLRGATAIAGRHSDTPGDMADIVYVGSSTEDRIQTFTAGRRDNAAAFLLPGNFFFLDAVIGNTGTGSSDTRGLQFSPTGDRMYVANRNPPTLQVYDTSLSPGGVPRNAPTGASDICRETSSLAVLDAGAGERSYVTCFQDGQIYVVDPSGQSQVEDIISVGRGPYGVAAISGKIPSTRKLLFVSNFLEDTIAVVDLDPGSPRHDRVVLRIGKPRTP
jgi:DNA-binding beta-propeller fold protein YncE